LITESRDAWRAEGKVWGDYFVRDVRRKVEDHTLRALLWSGPGDEAVALAGWELAGTLGRRGWLYLAEGYQRRAILETFLRRLDAHGESALPFLSWSDDVPGLPEEDRAAVFMARGFSPVVRADMRLPKGVHPPRPPSDPARPVRPLTLEDEPRIADLLYRVYAGEPERILFATTLDEREDARRATHGLLHGDVGRWLPEASFGIEEGGRLIAHTLANELEGGLITEVGVDPEYRRQGLARRLLPHTIDALRSSGFEVPRLVVTMWNPPAVSLYRHLGFDFVPGGDGRVWLNLGIFGIQPPSA